MKIPTTLLLLTGIALTSCHAHDQQEKEAYKLKATAAMEQKVSKVIEQLRQDCDSNILSQARYKADSLFKNQQHPGRNRKHIR